MTTEMVKAILLEYRHLQGEASLIRACSLRGENALTPALEQKIGIIESWLRLLTDEEWFVITKHLIDRQSWPMVMVEYENRWGQGQIRNERTLKRFQARALSRIVDCVEHHKLTHRIKCLFALSPDIIECSTPQMSEMPPPLHR